MKKGAARVVVLLSDIGYAAACVALYLIALCILFLAGWNILKDIHMRPYTVYKLLDEVGLIVFSMAVIDVGKYLLLEEVLKEESRNLAQTRKTVTKFAIIIASALALEGLVLTIETAQKDVTQLHYPIFLLLVAILFIVGVGIYQLLSARADYFEAQKTPSVRSQSLQSQSLQSQSLQSQSAVPGFAVPGFAVPEFAASGFAIGLSHRSAIC